MTTNEAAPVIDEVIEQGDRIYEEQLKNLLEPQQTGRYVAVEPETRRYFLGDTGTDALVAAHEAMPQSLFYLKRIGHEVTHRIGGYGLRQR